MTGNLNYPVILRISSYLSPHFFMVLPSTPYLSGFESLMFRFSRGLPTWNKQPKTHPTWGKTASTNPSPWALRPAQNLLKHIESSDLLNKFTIIIIHQIIKVMNILILTDFDKWFNMLHLKIKKKLAEALDSKKLCSLALDSRVCTWTKKGWNRNWRFNGWWLATPGVGKDRSK